MKSAFFIFLGSLLIFIATAQATTVELLENTEPCIYQPESDKDYCYSIYQICDGFNPSDLTFLFKTDIDNQYRTSLKDLDFETEAENLGDGCYKVKIEAHKNPYSSIDNVPCIDTDCFFEYAWWNSSWPYKIPITVSTSSGTTQENYQVKFDITASSVSGTSWSWANECIDSNSTRARFVNSTQSGSLDIYVENCSISGQKMTVWAEIDENITTSGPVIYLYHGNAAAPATSDGSATFVYYDGFERPALGSDWDEILGAGNNYPVTNTSYFGNSSLYIKAGEVGHNMTANFLRNRAIQAFWYDDTGLNDNDQGVEIGTNDYTLLMKLGGRYSGAGSDNAKYGYIDENVDSTWRFVGTRATAWHKLEYADNGTSTKYLIDDTEYHNTTGWAGVPFLFSLQTGTDAYYWDDVIVREYHDPEPSYSVGVETNYGITITAPSNGTTIVHGSTALTWNWEHENACSYSSYSINSGANTSSNCNNVTTIQGVNNGSNVLVLYANSTDGLGYSDTVSFDFVVANYTISVFDEVTGGQYNSSWMQFQVLCSNDTETTILQAYSTADVLVYCDFNVLRLEVNDSSDNTHWRTLIPDIREGNLDFFMVNMTTETVVKQDWSVYDVSAGFSNGTITLEKVVPDFGSVVVIKQRMDAESKVILHLALDETYTFIAENADGSDTRNLGGYLTDSDTAKILTLSTVPYRSGDTSLTLESLLKSLWRWLFSLFSVKTVDDSSELGPDNPEEAVWRIYEDVHTELIDLSHPCLEHSVAFNDRATEAGLESRIKAGFVIVYPNNDNELLFHSWNVVLINGEWKVMDTTMDALEARRIYQQYLPDTLYYNENNHIPSIDFDIIRNEAFIVLDPEDFEMTEENFEKYAHTDRDFEAVRWEDVSGQL